MNTKRIILFILAIFFTCNLAEARTITVKVSNIRGENGTILVMAQSGKETKPVYGMAKPEKGEQFDISVFHDENGNYQMDFTEDKKPAEGYAMKKCKTQQEEETVKLKLYYPASE